MKGYKAADGYMGYVSKNGYQLFESEDACYEWNATQYEYPGEGEDPCN